MGSVKDLEIIKKPTQDEMGVGRFHFSDRYSVFDWGEMPDLIANKGSSLCIIGAYYFEKLEELGIKTHYRGLIQDGKLLKLKELERPSRVMEVNLVRVIHPHYNGKYDYSAYTPKLKNFLIPLEIIYRNGLPPGSSVFKRLERGVNPEELGLDHYPQPGEELEKPLFDVSTKLEERDRYITWKEAQKIAALTDQEVREMKRVLEKTNQLITEIAGKANLKNGDGKIELAFNPRRELMVVDVLGTLDECRFTYQGLHVSKEVARQFYRKTPWYKEVEKAKKEAQGRGIKNWKSLCQSQPPQLDSRLKEIITNMYASVADQCTGIPLLSGNPVEEVMKEYKDYLESKG